MSLQIEYLMRKAQYQDLIDEAEHDRLVQLAKQSQAAPSAPHRQMVGWVGTQLVKWGAELQQYAGVTGPVTSMRIIE